MFSSPSPPSQRQSWNQHSYWHDTDGSRLTIWVWNSRNNVFAVGSKGAVVSVVVVMAVVVVVPRRHFCGIRCSAVLLDVELVQIAVVQGIATKQIRFWLEWEAEGSIVLLERTERKFPQGGEKKPILFLANKIFNDFYTFLLTEASQGEEKGLLCLFDMTLMSGFFLILHTAQAPLESYPELNSNRTMEYDSQKHLNLFCRNLQFHLQQEKGQATNNNSFKVKPSEEESKEQSSNDFIFLWLFRATK